MPKSLSPSTFGAISINLDQNLRLFDSKSIRSLEIRNSKIIISDSKMSKMTNRSVEFQFLIRNEMAPYDDFTSKFENRYSKIENHCSKIIFRHSISEIRNRIRNSNSKNRNSKSGFDIDDNLDSSLQKKMRK